MLKLYSAEACPFAQRTRALLIHLRLPFEIYEIDLASRDPEFLKLTPTGRVPFMVDGDLMLYESRVINEYIAERNAWDGAFAADPALRARQRLAMKQWDGVVVSAFYDSLGGTEGLNPECRRAVREELNQMGCTIQAMGSEVENLLAFHCAPHWIRMCWLEPDTGLTAIVSQLPPLRSWLDQAATLAAIQQTLPDRDRTIRRYRSRA